MGAHAGKRYGKDRLYSNWKMVCERKGLPYVPLYNGTKHSTVRGLCRHLRPDEIQKGTVVNTNKAFARYYAEDFKDEINVYQMRAKLRGDTQVIPIKTEEA
jgi:hypothetical protein